MFIACGTYNAALWIEITSVGFSRAEATVSAGEGQRAEQQERRLSERRKSTEAATGEHEMEVLLV